MTKPIARRPAFGRKMTTMRIDQPALDYCAGNFKSVSGGAGWLAEWAANALARALPLALSRLDQPERLALIDMHSGHMLNPQMAGPAHLALMVLDSAPEGLPQERGYDTEALAAKCEAMTTAESAAVAVWACGYWRAGHHEKMSMEEYANG